MSVKKYFSLFYIQLYSWIFVRNVILLGLSFLIIFPVLVKISSAFKPEIEIYDPTVLFIPKNPTLENFALVWTYMNYPVALFKSFMLSSVNGVIQVFSCTMIAYGLARFKFRGRGILFTFVLLTLVIPPQTILLPLFIHFKNFNLLALFTFNTQHSGTNLLNTMWPFILTSATGMGFKNGLFIYMLRQYFRNMPKELEEAGYIDGSGSFRTFYRIMLPGALSMMVTIFLFAFVWQWNDTFFTSIYMSNYKPLATQLSMVGDVIVRTHYGSDMVYNDVLRMLYNNSALLLHMIPLIILYVIAQRYFVQSIERSGLVG